MTVDTWLEERIGKPRAGKTTLVLCRSRATVTRVRRWMAEQGGWIGADVVTPNGLVASLYREPLGAPAPDPAQGLPAENPMANLIGERPGLVAAARRWLRRAREQEAIGASLQGVPPWLVDLARSDWSAHDDVQPLVSALERLRANPKQPTESHRYDRIVMLGFDSGLDILEPGSLAVARTLGLTTGDSEAFEPSPLPSVRVPDAVAEVRMATRLCLERPSDTLVLVSQTATARRLRDALHRNGLATGFTDPPPAAASALGGLVLRIIPWFTAEDPALRVSDVAWVFGHRVLAGDLAPPGQVALERERVQAEIDADSVRPSKRWLARMLVEAQVLDAPLSRWLTRLRVLLLDRERDQRIRGAALALWLRLRMLEARIAGESLGKALAADDSPGFDDFDALVAELLNEDLESQGRDAEPCSLGAVRHFVLDLRPRVHDDPAARAVLGQLRERDGLPADPATARGALATPVDPERLGVGIDVLNYDDWDGRPAGRLLLLDVHHKGLARRPSPDPLLDRTELESLGVLAGQALVDFRIATLHRAAAASDEVIAIVARRDPGGRDLVAPIQLQLRPIDGLESGSSYGVHHDLPELASTTALEVRREAEASAPDSSNTRLDHLARQATAEWYRAGRGPLPPAERPPLGSWFAPLDEHLLAASPVAPTWLMPWMGHADGPHAALPDRAWSTSKLFDPLASCLYRTFATAVLGVREPEPIPEDLDPRQIGTAIHDALEELTAGLALRVPARDLDATRQRVVDVLRASTATKLEQAKAQLVGLSEARSVAVDGRIARWNTHWPAWARSRVRAGTPSAFRDQMWFLTNHPNTAAALKALRNDVPGTSSIPDRTLKAWLKDTAWDAHRGRFPNTDSEVVRSGDRYSGLPTSLVTGLRAFLDGEAFRVLRRTAFGTDIRGAGAAAPIQATAAELPFGIQGEPGILLEPTGPRQVEIGEVRVAMGPHQIALQGQIDRVVICTYTHKEPAFELPLFEILDYKTGRAARPAVQHIPRDLWTGKQPQLMIYAMALQQAARDGKLGPHLTRATVASVGWDFVRFTEEEDQRNRYGRFLVDTGILDAVGERLGLLLTEAKAGRWTLRPRPDTCPAMTSFGTRCEVHEACRLRGLPPREAL